MIRVAFIGTAGRRVILTKAHARFMIDEAEKIIAAILEKYRRSDVTLVSGGAAWADHTAVLMAHKTGLPLKLFLPTAWDHEKRAYQYGGMFSPGGISNHYHRLYSRAVFGTDSGSLRHIDKLILDGGAQALVGEGFRDRNTLVAESEYVRAFTLAPGDTPADGGTKDTWNKALRNNRNCLHISLAGVKP